MVGDCERVGLPGRSRRMRGRGEPAAFSAAVLLLLLAGMEAGISLTSWFSSILLLVLMTPWLAGLLSRVLLSAVDVEEAVEAAEGLAAEAQGSTTGGRASS